MTRLQFLRLWFMMYTFFIALSCVETGLWRITKSYGEATWRLLHGVTCAVTPVLWKVISTFLCLGHTYLRATSGQDLVLWCLGEAHRKLYILQWGKVGSEQLGYVFFFRNGRVYDIYQHRDFHNRVRMLDPSVTNGNGSVIIRKIGVSDAGLYECVMAFGSQRTVLSEVKHSLNLTVTEQINDSTSTLIDVSVTPRSSKCLGRHPCVASSSLLLLIITLVTL